MNKMDHVVYSGWLVKSPPEKKLSGAWKIFRAKWKRRFFVLFKPASSLPGHYVLNYYRGEDCKKPKGFIDLEQCEQIIESLDSTNYPFLLAIKTFHRGKERTYFLATKTEEQMSNWVRSLCSVCELKPDENPTDLPPTHKDGLKKKTEAATNPISQVDYKQSPQQPVVKQPVPESYIPISDCHTGNIRKSRIINDAKQHHESVDSVPEEPAPPPPVKMGGVCEDDVFHPVTYDSPGSDEDDIYKVPPRRVYGVDRLLDPPTDPYDFPPPTDPYDFPPPTDPYDFPPPTDPYDFPPPTDPYDFPPPTDSYDFPPPTKRSPSTPRSSSSESQKVDSAYSSEYGLTYDIPPSRQDTMLVCDTYDIPLPSLLETSGSSDLPPARPLPTYKNVCMLSKSQGYPQNQVLPSQNSSTIITEDDIYDVPKSQSSDVNETDLMEVVPAPKLGEMTHNYMNAAPVVAAADNDVYFPMAGPNHVSHGNTMRTTNERDMNSQPNKQSVYDHPPRRFPAKSLQSKINNSSQDQNDTYSIFSTARTRSFKRYSHESSNTDKNHNKPGNASGRLQARVELPKRLEIQNSDPDMATSSEDEDGDILVSTGPLNIWSTTPPAPRKQQEELKYIDLALDESFDKEPVRSNIGHATGGSQTEYREIDFVKTKALSDVKKWKDVQRQQDDH